VINEAAVKKIADYVQIGRDEGAKLLCGGVRLTKGELGRGTFFAPTIFSDVARRCAWPRRRSSVRSSR
jgi:acyl-CoA reductase-like NAD-dependent aldehyde dehydrogenase